MVSVDCYKELQNDLTKFCKWRQDWKVEFNAEKWHIMEMVELKETQMGVQNGEYEH